MLMRIISSSGHLLSVPASFQVILALQVQLRKHPFILKADTGPGGPQSIPERGWRHTGGSSFDQLTSPVFKSVENVTPDPCARETVLNALKASRKRVVEEDITRLDGQENKRRRHDSSGSGQSAFESIVANGSPASLIPKLCSEAEFCASEDKRRAGKGEEVVYCLQLALEENQSPTGWQA
ncbi:nuclear envelope pore membrane protein POM 121-like [Lissotriton helveticus]